MPTAYEIVTESIIKQLESGVAPWRKPWRTAVPANLVSKKEYRGINVFLLASQGYGSRYWLTYRQAQSVGGMSRKESTVPRSSCGRSTSIRSETPRAASLRTTNPFSCAITPCSTSSSAKGSNSLILRRPSIPLSNAEALSGRCHIHQLSCKKDKHVTAPQSIQSACRHCPHSISPRNITRRCFTNSSIQPAILLASHAKGS